MLERYHLTKNFLGLSSCTIVAAKFASASQQHLVPDTFYPALAHTINTHAALSVYVVGERGSRPCFATIREIDFEKAVRFTNQSVENLATLMEGEFMKRFDASVPLPLWRFIVTDDNIVIFSWHHAIADGQSGLAVLRTLLEGLNNRDSTKHKVTDYRSFNPVEGLKLEPTLEDMMNLSVSLKTFVKEISGAFLPKSWVQRTVWTGNKVPNATADTVKTSVRIITIPASSASHLLALARARKATLTSVMYVIGVVVLSRLISARAENRKFKHISTFVDVSLRPVTKTPLTVMCEAVSSLHVRYEPLLYEFSWNCATIYATKLHKFVPNSYENIGMLKYLFGKYEKFYRDKFGKTREGSFELSNLGAFKTNLQDTKRAENGNWRIEEMYFSQDDGVEGCAVKISAVGSPNGIVTASISWGEASFDEALGENFTKGFEEQLSDLLKENMIPN